MIPADDADDAVHQFLSDPLGSFVPDPQCRAAQELAGRGWHVFPCKRGGKRPVVADRWEQRATTDLDLIARWWPEGANVGIACGPSKLVVVDLDTHGQLPAEWQQPGVKNGLDVFVMLLEWAGEISMPATYWVVTPSGGWHLYFRAPEDAEIRNSAGKLGPMVDVRAAGGYVVGAGSVVDGHPYLLVSDTDPAPLPGWITRALTRPPPTANTRFTDRDRYWPDSAGPRAAALAETVHSAPEGQRNSTLYWAACRAADMVAEGADPSALSALLFEAAMHVGLDEAEINRTIASGMRGAP